MKKCFATILALIYLSSSMGATVHLHYCMGKLISWGLVDQKGKNCTYCGMPKSMAQGHCIAAKDGCCKDEHKHIQTDKDQKTTESGYKYLDLAFDLVAICPASIPDHYVSCYITGYPTTNAPPDPGKIPVFLRNCNFRI